MVIRVLLADQSATIQRLAAQTFAQEKIEVIRVGNGDLASWLLDEITPDLVIADVSLPDRNGYELCRLIKDDPRLSHIPVLLLCWSDETFDHEKANDARADSYLTKPFESRALVETVRKLLNEKGERHDLSTAAPSPNQGEAGLTESLGPLDAPGVVGRASSGSYSQAADTESKESLAVEELLAVEESLPIEAPLPAPDGPPEVDEVIDPPADAGPHLTIAAPATKVFSHAAPHEQGAGATTAPGSARQRPIKSPLVWAVLAIIALSSILGIWQAIRTRKMQLAIMKNANESQAAVTANANDSQGDQPTQPGAPVSPDVRPELPQPDEPSESKAPELGPPSEQHQLSNPRGYDRNNNSGASSPGTRFTPAANANEARGANANKAVNNNNSADLKVRTPPQAKPPETNRASTPPAKNDKPEQSPVRIIQGNAAGPSAPGKAKSDGSANQAAESPNGFQQIGSGVKGAVVWTGRKAGQGIKVIARAVKRVFKRDRRMD